MVSKRYASVNIASCQTAGPPRYGEDGLSALV